MKEKTLSRKTVFQGRLLHVEVQQVSIGRSVRSTREIVRHPGAAVILARLPDGRFVFVRQYRKPVEREMLEVVAGTLSKGEAPKDCAMRELREETGYGARRMIKLGIIFPSPGYLVENLHLYFAELDGKRGQSNLDDDEKLKIVCLTAKQIEQKIRTGKIQDAKTIAAWLLFKLKIARGATA